MALNPGTYNQLDEAVWEECKETLRKLYLVEDKSLGEIQMLMETDYSFRATKSQYERHFKQWKFRKNLGKEGWESVRHHVSKRKRSGKESEVLLNGIAIDAKKVKKETERYSYDATFRQYIERQSPPIPDGVDIQTPASSETSLLPVEDLPLRAVESWFDRFRREICINPLSLPEYGHDERLYGTLGARLQEIVPGSTAEGLIDPWGSFVRTHPWPIVPQDHQTVDSPKSV